jgi:hypothetical protein
MKALDVQVRLVLAGRFWNKLRHTFIALGIHDDPCFGQLGKCIIHEGRQRVDD